MQSEARASAGIPFLRRYRGALTFALAVLALLAAWFGGNWLYAEWSLGGMQFEPLEAGRVNLFGVALSGERIIVANGTAMLIRGAGTNDKDAGASGEDARGPAVPIRALIGSLRGDQEALSELLESLSDIDPAAFPPPEMVWEEEQLRAALKGDQQLVRKLENQLGTTLSGEPAERISLANLREGITVRVRVPVKVLDQRGKAREVEGIVRVNYRTRLAQEILNNRVVRDSFNPTEAALYGVVQEVWRTLRKSPQDVRGDLERLLDDVTKERYAHPVESLLARTTILATEREITDASLKEYDDPTRDRSLFSLRLTLTDEARYRLWKYTRGKGRLQLLFAVDGIAVAAPIVQHEMKYSVAEILNVSDEVDARKAVQVIKDLHEKRF
ncbi:MAG: hypothetical protein C4341_03090 [Armatimonadota bacterium]